MLFNLIIHLQVECGWELVIDTEVGANYVSKLTGKLVGVIGGDVL
jgi:hypothetical protein